MRTNPPGLSLESLGHLNYIAGLLSQPLGRWDGFYQPQSPSMNFALRYQLAFGAYALAALAQRTPAYRAPYVQALQGAIEKILDGASWGYWRAPDGAAQREGHANPFQSGHVAVLLSPHQRASVTVPSDPIVRDNLQYSGHLSTMLGLYEKLAGDDRYDRPFTLTDPDSGASYTYTHGQVAGRIHEQMVRNSIGGVFCESGMAYVPCNNHALASNALHDALHGSRFSRANARWLRTVRRKMVLKGPALRGIFGACYVKDLGMAAPVAFNFTDAWGLAFMLPFDPALVRKLYPRFRGRITGEGSDGAYLGSAPLSEKMEISDVPINTGFALIAARGIGDEETADALDRYASRAFEARWHGDRYLLSGAPRTLHSTALYALAGAVEPGGEGFSALFNAPPIPSSQGGPMLIEASSSNGSIGVSRADYAPVYKTLNLHVRQVADPAFLKSAPPAQAILTLTNVGGAPRVEVEGAPLPASSLTRLPNGNLRFSLPVAARTGTACVVRV